MRERLKKWTLTLIAGGYYVGSLLGMTLTYIIKGEFNISNLLWSLAGALILISINTAMVYLKKDKTPYNK